MPALWCSLLALWIYTMDNIISENDPSSHHSDNLLTELICIISSSLVLFLSNLIQRRRCWPVFTFHFWEVIAQWELPSSQQNSFGGLLSLFPINHFSPRIPVIPHPPALPPHPTSEPNHAVQEKGDTICSTFLFQRVTDVTKTKSHDLTESAHKEAGGTSTARHIPSPQDPSTGVALVAMVTWSYPDKEAEQIGLN